MERLIEGIGNNSSQEYDRIFKESQPDWQDHRRWKELIKYYKGGNILDIGCLFSEIYELAKLKDNCVYLGTDVAKEAIKQMRNRHSHGNNPGCDFIVDDIYQSNVKDEIADYIVMGEVLEHLEKPVHALFEALRILKPNGILAISVPLDEAKEFGAVDGSRHIWSFIKQDFQNLLELSSSKLKFKVLRSQKIPYKYCWPQLLIWAWKK